MENFIIKIVALVCVSIVSTSIVISRKDDIGIFSVIVAAILEILIITIVLSPEIIMAIKEIIALF